MRLLLPLTFLVPQFLATTASTIVPSVPVPGRSETNWISNTTGFDSPKVHPINSSVYDWWYFDAVQASDDRSEQASVVVTFYTATSTGFDFLAFYEAEGFSSLALAEATVTWPNGTSETFLFNATEANITTVENGAEGLWDANGESATFIGAPDLTTYRVHIESPLVVGTLFLQSIAPAHYPCGPAAPGQTMQVAPHIGWANAVPDAKSSVRLMVHGEPLHFHGTGYHDKNWGDRSFGSSVGAWYWGHGRLGPYSIVWFDHLSPQKENFVSAYVARDGEIVVAQCEGITVRPFGENATYPPLNTTGSPTGYRIHIDLPTGEELELTATGENRISPPALTTYARFTGRLEGTVDGEELVGEALYDYFHSLPA
ncbi:hypothetical protein BDW62DRAFT_219719 [Aspergillus aurantiobrunneus]